MRQLFPSCVDMVSPLDLLEDTLGRRGGGEPWVVANMVMGVDGSFSIDGRSGGLSSPGDKQLFHGLRAMADVVLVGAGTARAERYRRPSPGDDARKRRVELGRTERPRLALVSRTGRFPPDQPFLSGPGPDPIVFRPADPPADDSTRVAGTSAGLDPLENVPTVGVEARVAGVGSIDLGEVVRSLHDDGAAVILCEGGPQLLGDLCEQGILDELFVTISPKLGGGKDTGLLGSVRPLGLDLELVRVLEEADSLMLDYFVRR